MTNFSTNHFETLHSTLFERWKSLNFFLLIVAKCFTIVLKALITKLRIWNCVIVFCINHNHKDHFGLNKLWDFTILYENIDKKGVMPSTLVIILFNSLQQLLPPSILNVILYFILSCCPIVSMPQSWIAKISPFVINFLRLLKKRMQPWTMNYSSPLNKCCGPSCTLASVGWSDTRNCTINDVLAPL